MIWLHWRLELHRADESNSNQLKMASLNPMRPLNLHYVQGPHPLLSWLYKKQPIQEPSRRYVASLSQRSQPYQISVGTRHHVITVKESRLTSWYKRGRLKDTGTRTWHSCLLDASRQWEDFSKYLEHKYHGSMDWIISYWKEFMSSIYVSFMYHCAEQNPG